MKKKTIIILSISILTVLIIFIGSSYALFSKTQSALNKNEYQTGVLQIEYSSDSTLTINPIPLTDTEGASSTPYTFTITNTGTLDYQYDLKILTDSTYVANHGCANNQTPAQYIKVKLDDSEPVLLSNLTSGTIISGETLAAGASKTYNLRMWLDISSPNSIIGSHFHGKIVSEGEAIYTELNKPNAPVLASGMIPIKYDGTKWVKADTSNTNNSWYNYDNKEWANVALVSDSKIVENITTNKSVTINNQSNTYTTYSSFSSTNGSVHSSTSSSTITVNIHSSGTFGFRSIVSSESNYDKLTVKVKKNSDAETTVSNAISGSNSNNYSDSTAKSGDVYVITVSYTKDSSVSSGNDKGTLDTFTYPANTHVTIAGSGSYPWVASGATNNTVYDNKIGTGITYNTSTQKYDLVSPTSSVISSSTIGKYVCPTITQTSCTTAYKVTAASTSITKVDEYSSSTATGTRADYLNAEVGTEIKEEDILAYYVWIPRYKYQLFNVDSTTMDPIEIQIKFEEGIPTKSSGTSNGEWLTHPAFTLGTDELEGIWVGKFSTTGSAETPTSKPNLLPLTNQNVSTQFTTSQIFGTTTYLTSTGVSEVDAHMMKNIEWGAVAYLKQSKYGLGTTDIGLNNYFDQTDYSNGGTNYLKTGCGATSGSAVSTTCNAYNTTDGMLASTTGNITGVYDMSAAMGTYVMGVMQDNTGTNTPMSGRSSSYNSGFTGKIYDSGNFTDFTGTPFPNTKYYDLYAYGTTYSDQTAYNRRILGDATGEVHGWYGDYADFVGSDSSWFVRGSSYLDDPAYAGVFSFFDSDGGPYSLLVFRSVLAPGA